MAWPRTSLVLEDIRQKLARIKKERVWEERRYWDFLPSDRCNENNTRRNFATVICVEPHSTAVNLFISLVWLVPSWLSVPCSFLMSFSFSPWSLSTSPSCVSDLPVRFLPFIVGQEYICCTVYAQPTRPLMSNKSTWYIQFWVHYYCYNVPCKLKNVFWYCPLGCWGKRSL